MEGHPQSMTQAFASDMRTARSVLDCASPLALSGGTATDAKYANRLPARGNFSRRAKKTTAAKINLRWTTGPEAFGFFAGRFSADAFEAVGMDVHQFV